MAYTYFKPHWNDRLTCTYTQQVGGDGGNPKTDSSPEALEWEGGVNMNVYGQLERFDSLLHPSRVPSYPT